MSNRSGKIRRAYKKLAAVTALITVAIVIAVIWASIAFTPDFRNVIDKYAAEYGVDNRLIYAIVDAESGFDPFAESHKGALGLMQLMPSTAQWLSDGDITESELLNPEINIKLGVKLISQYFAKYRDIHAVLCAYNAGEGNLVKWQREGADLSAPPFKETANYIKNVKIYYKFYCVFNARL